MDSLRRAAENWLRESFCSARWILLNVAMAKEEIEDKVFVALTKHSTALHIGAASNGTHMCYADCMKTYADLERQCQVHQNLLMALLPIQKALPPKRVEEAFRRFGALHKLKVDEIKEATGVRLMMAHVGRTQRTAC